MPLQLGSAAPDATLFENTPETVRRFRLSDYFGKRNLVLLFFPAVYTGTCTKEMCLVRDTSSDYDALDAMVIGISGDMPYSQLVWKRELKLTTMLASDYNHEAVRAYEVEHPDWAGGMHGVARRAAFVVDKSGIIRYAEVLEDAGMLPSFEGIQLALRELH